LSLITFEVRPAQAADHTAIKSIVRAARITPFGLDWPRFIVAESAADSLAQRSGAGQQSPCGGHIIIGVGQVKPHRDGSRELASIVVVPEYRRQDVASALIRALIERENGPLYLTCRRELEGFYERFGFKVVPRSLLPPYLARIHLLGSLFSPFLAIFGAQHLQIIAMIRTL
jgi:amino-acid N-acetyltransferase